MIELTPIDSTSQRLYSLRSLLSSTENSSGSSLNGIPIPVVEKTKSLGLQIFDRKLSFTAHLHYVMEKCLKAMNLLRVVVHTSYAAELTNKHF